MAHRTAPSSQQQLCNSNQVKHLLSKSSLGHQTLSEILRIEPFDLPPYMFKAYHLLFKVVNGIKSNIDYVNLIAKREKNPETFRYLIAVTLEAQQAKCLAQAGWAQQGHTLSRCKSANAH